MKIGLEADQPTGRQIHATLEHLSGSGIGTESWLYGEKIEVSLGEGWILNLNPAESRFSEIRGGKVLAEMVRSGGTYRLEAVGSAPVWVNGRKIHAGELIDGDIIEFGEKGPLSRYRLTDNTAHSRRYFADICVDCWDYIRTSRKPIPVRVAKTIGGSAYRLASETTLLFRVGVIATLMLLGFATYQQHQIGTMQKERLAAGQVQLDRFSTALARTQQEALTPSDLEEVRDALTRNLSNSLGRIEALEAISKSTKMVIINSAPSVVFVQGAYGFREAATGRVMRHVVNSDNQPLAGPNGMPLLSLDGNGPPAERTFTGTAFAIADGTVLVTNRHVAEPWNSDGSAGVAANHLEPFMIKIIAYSPDLATERPLELIKSSDDADLALLRFTTSENPLAPLRLARAPVTEGEVVIVMGYPTGFRSMLARAGKGFVEDLQRQNQTNFWQVARFLSAKGFIKPLSSSGIVAQSTFEFLVYDAATTHGGSGGPVLSSSGEVVAINAAILPDYSGSNFGVPVQKLLELIAETDIKLVTKQVEN